ncbi:D-2-hydroxyacid dehydrogenase [Neisseria sp. P0009.S001]|jgi:glycerate dehydrogenase|uniref:4-phosphoerythronate dehydrogenase n=1 Tax=Neisseria subflava NJ9703 TaxID=546268 RepID=A0A9W5N0L6_NEISU|nr:MULTISPECIES: D-2-hydroxyacid dehydrogenase [Neisseria]MBF1298103.1 D-2-hydroxyacid dehydrogenase [Neisseria sp.]MBS6064421.1 D-2-hydroxyacid dehydrogenase [Neisseria mucosa]MDU4875883.1 D-2-hydroxyacid dehydrogenase [Neisseria subflava]EFC53466.1 4-phosphoerythronate dehydrogenase [Neisseria subflava NJ9703]MDU6146895.1 D-2-hydroxyacid dehydrogenase [Neisseria subflava]
MNPLQIVVLDRDTLVNRPFEFDFPHTLSSYGTTEAHETLARIRGADIIITNKVVISAEHIAANPQLKLIALAATGVNNVDVEAAKQNGTAVCNIRAYGNESVAEHAFMMMITLMRNLPAYQRDVAAGLWENSPFFCYLGAPMRDLNGKTLAIFGRGNIGKTLATYAQAFKMNVVFAEHKNAQSVRDGYVSFDEAIRSADVVSLNCPLTPQTANMIGEAELQQMKPGAILINCGRGGLVDEAALVAALKYGQIGGAGFDVLTQEPPRDGNPLLKARLPNLIVTPHIAWASQEAANRLFDILLDNINRFVAGNPQNLV